jgi:hypothetical protein
MGWFAWTACEVFNKKAIDDPLRPLRASLLIALVAFFVMALSHDAYRQRVLWLLFAIICAASQPGAFARVAGEPTRVRVPEPDRA